MATPSTPPSALTRPNMGFERFKEQLISDSGTPVSKNGRWFYTEGPLKGMTASTVDRFSREQFAALPDSEKNRYHAAANMRDVRGPDDNAAAANYQGAKTALITGAGTSPQQLGGTLGNSGPIAPDGISGEPAGYRSEKVFMGSSGRPGMALRSDADVASRNRASTMAAATSAVQQRAKQLGIGAYNAEVVTGKDGVRQLLGPGGRVIGSSNAPGQIPSALTPGTPAPPNLNPNGLAFSGSPTVAPGTGPLAPPQNTVAPGTGPLKPFTPASAPPNLNPNGLAFSGSPTVAPGTGPKMAGAQSAVAPGTGPLKQTEYTPPMRFPAPPDDSAQQFPRPVMTDEFRTRLRGIARSKSEPTPPAAPSVNLDLTTARVGPGTGPIAARSLETSGVQPGTGMMSFAGPAATAKPDDKKKKPSVFVQAAANSTREL